MKNSIKSLTLVFVCTLTLLFSESCKDKKEPDPGPVVVGREGDTCRLAKTTMSYGHSLAYTYAGARVQKITLNADGGTYPCELIYDASGKLLKVSGKIVDTQYEYDANGRVVKESRTLHLDSVNTFSPHFGARLFEYNEAGQIKKCSYVEGRGPNYNSPYLEKGEVYRYEEYTYDAEGDVITMAAFGREPKDTKFKVLEEYAYFYDKMINPFYGHPGVFDYQLYLGMEVCNLPAVLSKHNIIRRAEKGVGAATSHTYTSTKYPLVSTNVPWLDHRYLESITMEYQNCK